LFRVIQIFRALYLTKILRLRYAPLRMTEGVVPLRMTEGVAPLRMTGGRGISTSRHIPTKNHSNIFRFFL